MKKLTIILLALAVAAIAVPAFAGDVTISGKYTLDAENYSGSVYTISGPTAGDEKKTAWYDDELKVTLGIAKGDVSAVINLEVSDDENFDMTGDYDRSTGPGNAASSGGDIVESFWVEWKAMDNLKVKVGEYQINFGRKVVIFEDPAAKHIGLTYSLDKADLGLYIGKVDEVKDNDDNDTDAMSLLVNVKGVEFFKKLDFLYVTQTDKNDPGADVKAGYMGLDTAFKAGPVDVAFEYGSVSNDGNEDNEGNFMFAELGFDELAGFDINLEVFRSTFEDGSLEGTFGANDYYPLMIYAFRSGVNGSLSDLQMFIISGSYALNDKAKIIGRVLASGTAGPDDEAVGTEIDAHLAYKFSDNVSATFTYATWSPGEAYDGGFGGSGDSQSDMRARFVFSF